MPGRRLRARDAPPEPGACGCPSRLSHAERLPKVCVPRKRGTIEPPSRSQVTSSLIEIFPAFPRHPLRSSEGFRAVISRGRPGRDTEGPSSSRLRGRASSHGPGQGCPSVPRGPSRGRSQGAAGTLRGRDPRRLLPRALPRPPRGKAEPIHPAAA